MLNNSASDSSPSEDTTSWQDYAADKADNATATRVVFFGNEFPSDDLRHLFRLLQQHSRNRQFPLLSLWVHEATAVVRQELAALPLHLQHQVPYFETVLNLPENGDFRDEGLGAAMEGAFLVVLQVGMFIG